MSRAKELAKYTFTRLALAPLMLWLISTFVFLLLRIAPGDPVDAILGTRANEATRLALRTKLGLDKSILAQYLEFLGKLIHGDLGLAINTQEPVREIISRSLPASIELGFFSLIIAIIIGSFIGFIGAAKPQGKADLLGRIYGISTYALPPFWAAMIIQLFFAVILGWLPVGGRFPPSIIQPEGSGFLVLDSILNGNIEALVGSIRHLILPSFTLGILLSGIFSRSLRMNLETTLSKNFIEAAKSRGLKKNRILFRHALPNALLPVFTIAGLTIASLIGGALLIEVTFSWPGIALGLQEAINQRDYPVVQGIVLVVATLIVITSLIVDLLIASIDPRVHY